MADLTTADLDRIFDDPVLRNLCERVRLVRELTATTVARPVSLLHRELLRRGANVSTKQDVDNALKAAITSYQEGIRRRIRVLSPPLQ